MKRRYLLAICPASLLLPLASPPARANSNSMTLLTAPIDLIGPWRGSAPTDAGAVIERMRSACLTGITPISDHQPEKLRIEDHSEGPPSIWLHSDLPTTAEIIVDVGPRDWCNLAYQFGHEFGHVVANSWQADAAPRNPCQWVEEALVEAFSLNGLAHLADGWEQNPPFPNDGAYAGAIRSYRQAILDGSRKVALEQGMAAGFATWFHQHAEFLASHGGVTDARGAVPTMLSLYEADPTCLSDLGALNRWPERSSLPLPEYLRAWHASCLALRTPARLPIRLEQMFAGG